MSPQASHQHQLMSEIKCSCLNWILWQIYPSETEKELSLQRWSEWSKKRSVVFSLLFSNLHHGYATHWHEVPSHSCSRFCMQQLSCWQAQSGGAVSPLKSSAKLPQQQLLAPIYHLLSVPQESDLLLRPKMTVEGCYLITAHKAIKMWS